MQFNYTEAYKNIYNAIKREYISHEDAHRASLRVCDTMMDLYLLTKQKEENLQKVIIETMQNILDTAENEIFRTAD